MNNEDKTVEYNSLSWVKAQLDDVVSDAQTNLSEYIENKTDENLENCIEHLQLIYGTLQMVEIYGAAMLAEEMQLTTVALLAGDVERAEDTYDVLMRAMLQLPDYLEGIQSGKKDAPIALMPLFNDLRTARKEGLLSESILFSPDIENADLVSDGYNTEDIESGNLQAEVKKLRIHYQLGLLDYIRNNKERVGLQRIKAVLNALEKNSSVAEIRRIWMVAGALVEGLMKQGIDPNLSVKMLLGAVDRQLKLILDIDEQRFAKKYSKELVKNLLYYVGLSKVDSKAISAVKQAYHLNDLIPQGSDETNDMIGGLNADLFDTVSQGITEDLTQVKDILELFMQSSERNLKQLVPVTEKLGKIADTYGMLGLGSVRQSLMDQCDIVHALVNGDTEISEPVVASVAYELLNAESELKDYIAERSGFIDMNRVHEDQTVPAAEYRQVVRTVVSEGLKNFSKAKEALLAYVSGIGDKEQLNISLNKLEEVRGVSLMLPLGRVESLIEKLQQYIRVALLGNNHQPSDSEQDTIADVVTSVEYFFEALIEGRPGVEQGLNAGDEAANKLASITESYGDLAPTATDEIEVESADDDIVIVEDAAEVDDISEQSILAVEDADDELASSEPATSKPATSKPVVRVVRTDAELLDVSEFDILADDADEEIVEIFIEEAIEVLGELHTYLPQWKADDKDEEALAVVRRSFHTLKGSGRLLGANLIGEFSWKFENILNRVIDNKINVSETLLHTLDESLTVLPQLIEQLKGNREPIDNLAQLMAAADAISEGRDVAIDPGVQIAAVDDLAIADTDTIVDDEETATEASGSSDKELEIEAEPSLGFEIDDLEIENEADVIKQAEQIEQESEQESEHASDETEQRFEEKIIEGYAESVDESVMDVDIELTDNENLSDLIDLAEENVSVEDISIEELTAATDSEIISLDEAPVAEEFAIELSPDEDELSIVTEPDDVELIETAMEEVIEIAEAEDIIDVEELSTSAHDDDFLDKFEIEIEEIDDAVSDVATALNLDPMLLKIYCDESQGHVAVIRQLLEDSKTKQQPLKADKTLVRAFHTLYGSARTAEVDAIADISGAAEKYVKARQECNEEDIPEEVAVLLSEAETAISRMLVDVDEGKLPTPDKVLQEKINKIVQQEIQSQLQRSWQDNSSFSEAISETSASENSAPTTVEVKTDDSNDLSIELSELHSAFDDENVSEDEVSPKEEDVKKSDTTNDVLNVVKPGSGITEKTTLMSYGDIDDELIDIFIEEADELLESCEETLNEIRETPNSTEHIHQLQRHMHTLKGGARMADLTPVGDLTHSLESLVVLMDENKIKPDNALFDLLQESLDVLIGMLASVKKREPVSSANELSHRVELLMRGEIEEKRSVERFDVEFDELQSGDDEELEEIDISALLERKDNDTAPDTDDDVSQKKTKAAKSQPTDAITEESPHWGERASDVNFKDNQEQVRVRSDLLNNLVNYAGEVSIYHARMGKQISDFGYNLSELTQTVVRLKEQLRKLAIETEIQIRSSYEKESDGFDESFDPLEMDQYSTLQQLSRSLSETAGDVESINEILAELTRDSETLLVQEARISTDLQEGLMRTRMVRFGGLSSRLRRIVRQISRELGKEVELEIIGASSEVDRTVLDRIIAPLEHLIRNAVAHGIESPELRKNKGKNEAGKIIIDVDREGADIVINVSDDGAGIDVEKIRAKAIKLGFTTADSELSEHDALQFILQSGFSTSDEVTQVSGRGVGMDVVDSEIKQLGGVLDIETKRDVGSTFHIRLPLTLAINQALLVKTTEDVYAIPLSSIEGVVRITGLELQRFYDSDHNFYEFNGIEYELKHLGGLLTGHQGDYSKQLQLFPVILVHVGDKYFALHVDDLLGRREIVVKPVGMQIGGVRGIAGATILADGRVVLILEMSALVVADSLFKEHVPVAEHVEPVLLAKTTVMVVDDSITIRKVTERMLLRYGIEVILAKDGVDATNQLQDIVPDLMLLDIEMPRMDGFEVATFVRNDERLKELPIIMITSRTGAKHKEKAMKIGVNEYLGKPFQEDDLVSNINKILHTTF